MTLTDLLEEFNVVIDTPQGLTELRSLILGLAVRGKLVSQDPNDEPASELLRKIEDEKQRLYMEGEIRKPKKLDFVSDRELPFDIPESWEWCRLGKIYGDIGTTNPESKFSYIDVGSIDNSLFEIDYNEVENIPAEDAPSRARREVKDGSVVYSTVRPYLMNVAIVKYIFDFKPIASTAFEVINVFEGILNKYVYRYLLSDPFLDYVNFKMVGVAYPAINKGDMQSAIISIPPTAEQHRIVQRIETLFAEVDELEEKLNLQTKLDEKLQLAVNAEVQKAPDADASKTAWRFISTNFDTLYHTPEAIDNLKKNILNEAVRGRLVPQDPNDEPASELLKKIEFEKQRLYDEGEIRKPKDLPPVDEEEIPFEIPESWEWCRFGDLASTVEYGTSQKAHKEPNGVPVLRMGNIDENGNMSFDNLKYVNEDIKDLPRLYLKNDDLVFNRTNSYELVGKMGLFKERNEKFTLASYLIRSTLLTDIFPEYIHHYFNSHHCRVNEIEPEITKQTNQANFNGTKLQNVRVPLSAKEEQHRVVQRIEELFAICDRFKAQLEQRQAVNERLVKGLVGEVLEGS